MPDASATTRFGLIRHAETVWNRARRIQGQQDSPLTARGRRQAERWGEALAAIVWQGILTSDAGRAAATAARVNLRLNLPVASDPRLRELDWGRWTGKTVAELRAEEPGLVAAQEAAGWGFTPPGGESRRQQLARSRQALCDAARRRPGATILVVSHEGVIKAMAHHLSGSPFTEPAAVALAPGHLHWVAVSAGELVLEGLNAMALE
jgi:probable phosphoglycerate mutase